MGGESDKDDMNEIRIERDKKKGEMKEMSWEERWERGRASSNWGAILKSDLREM